MHHENGLTNEHEKYVNMFDFIHVGYGKCMSTTLQNMWARSSNNSLHSANDLIFQVDSIFHETIPDVDLALTRMDQLDIYFQADQKNGINVLSGEALSFSFIDHDYMGDYILLKQKLIAQLLGETTDKILIMVRDPIKWIYSTHAQHIKQGGCTSFNDYLMNYRSVILNNLNLSALIKYWNEANCDVIVIPIELYEHNIHEFWKVYEEKLNVPAPDRRDAPLDVINANITRYDTLDIHQYLNAAMFVLEDAIGRDEFAEQRSCQKAIEYIRKWGTRRALTFSSEDENAVLRQLLGLQNSPGQPDIHIDNAFFEYIQTYFMNAIPNEEYFTVTGIVQGYQASLNSALQGSSHSSLCKDTTIVAQAS